jgi:hypothetical protein
MRAKPRRYELPAGSWTERAKGPLLFARRIPVLSGWLRHKPFEKVIRRIGPTIFPPIRHVKNNLNKLYTYAYKNVSILACPALMNNPSQPLVGKQFDSNNAKALRPKMGRNHV